MSSTSAASKLLEYIRAWQVIPAGVAPTALRGDGNDWWTTSVDAVRCVTEVEQAIEDADDEEMARSYDMIRGEVRDVVFSTRIPLESQDSSDRRTIDDKTLAVLGSVVSGLNFRAYVVSIAPETQALSEFLNRLRGELTSAHLDEKTLGYLLVLIGHLEQALVEARVRGVADVVRCADELIGALSRLYVKTDGDETKKTTGMVKMLTRKVDEFLNSPFVSAVLGAAVGSGIGQITAG